jgi:hypothetical protein
MHVKCLTFEGTTPSATGFVYTAARSSVGPKRVVSIVLTPRFMSDGPLAQAWGTIMLYDTPALTDDDPIPGGLGAAKIRFPMHLGRSYGGSMVSVISDIDGYILFSDGITIDSKLRSGLTDEAENPILQCKVDIFYV